MKKKLIYEAPDARAIALRSEDILEESPESRSDLDLPFPGDEVEI